jgi:geranylgeranyl diphosphate synthase type I
MSQNKLIFFRHKEKIDFYLSDLLKKQATEFTEHQSSKRLFEYLDTFVKSGKSVRGALFLEAVSEFMGEEKVDMYLPVAAGIELIHSALLIQDDFMDQDDSRRNMPTFHTNEHTLAKHTGYRKPEIYAPSAVMCATDIIFFLAFEQLSLHTGENMRSVWKSISKEYAQVGFAQWQDVVFSSMNEDESVLSQIKNVYRYKTARYTFVMPVLVAGIISKVAKSELHHLEKIFEAIGVVFQIRDDYLSLFGDEALTGKPVGGDVIENKKTMYRHFLFVALKKDSNLKCQQMQALYGKSSLTPSEIRTLQECHKKLGVVDALQKVMDSEMKVIWDELEKVSISESFKKEIKNIVQFVAHRER